MGGRGVDSGYPHTSPRGKIIWTRWYTPFSRSDNSRVSATGVRTRARRRQRKNRRPINFPGPVRRTIRHCRNANGQRARRVRPKSVKNLWLGGGISNSTDKFRDGCGIEYNLPPPRLARVLTRFRFSNRHHAQASGNNDLKNRLTVKTKHALATNPNDKTDAPLIV